MFRSLRKLGWKGAKNYLNLAGHAVGKQVVKSGTDMARQAADQGASMLYDTVAHHTGTTIWPISSHIMSTMRQTGPPTTS